MKFKKDQIFAILLWKILCSNWNSITTSKQISKTVIFFHFVSPIKSHIENFYKRKKNRLSSTALSDVL